MDLTHLALDSSPSDAADRLVAIANALPEGRRVQVGAEDAARTDAVLTCVLEVAGRGFADRLGATLQANLLRSPVDADTLTDAGVHVRLVKGAYVETTGVHPYGEPTDVAYLRLGFRLAEAGATWSMATHAVGCAKHSCSPWGQCRSSSCLAYGTRLLTSYARATSRPGSMSPTAPTGSGTGSDASPSPAAPDRWPPTPQACTARRIVIQGRRSGQAGSV